MSLSSLVLRSSIVSLTCLSLLSGVNAAAYTLETTYEGANFFDGFNFFTDADPTNGFVTYVDQATALSGQLISSAAGAPAYMGVDSANTYNASMFPGGRTSVRIESKATYNHFLLISDLAHTPGGVCGTWPAHWTLGPSWPTHGEIDILEGINSGATQNYENLMSLHTSPGCTIAGANELGTLQSNDCDTNANQNSGCGVTANSANYGAGGVYATEWTSEYIRIWYFATGSVPANIQAGNPDPTTWGLPQANFEGSCDIDSKVSDQRIIFDTTFCGDYAGAKWSSDEVCSAQALTCNDFVADNPSIFADAYWSINSLKVYKPSTSSVTTSVPVVAPTSSTPLPSVAPHSSVLAPGMGFNSSSSRTSTSVPSTISSISAPAVTATSLSVVGDFKYLGCASSSNGFSTFSQVDSSVNMTLEKCTSECSSFEYAGIYNALCFCANSLGDDTTVTPGQGQCKNVCPGNGAEFCGGTSNSLKYARQVASNILLSLYQNTATALVSVTPASSILGIGMGGSFANYTFSIINAIYIDVCDTCANGYTTVTTSATVPHCNCIANEAEPTIPLTVTTKVCSVCGTNGGPATVTVTVPADLTAAAAAAGVATVTALPTSGATGSELAGPEATPGTPATPAIGGNALGTNTVVSPYATFTGGAVSLAVNIGAVVAVVLGCMIL